jgi:hypothetical protein
LLSACSHSAEFADGCSPKSLVVEPDNKWNVKRPTVPLQLLKIGRAEPLLQRATQSTRHEVNDIGHREIQTGLDRDQPA